MGFRLVRAWMVSMDGFLPRFGRPGRTWFGFLSWRMAPAQARQFEYGYPRGTWLHDRFRLQFMAPLQPCAWPPVLHGSCCHYHDHQHRPLGGSACEPARFGRAAQIVEPRPANGAPIECVRR